MDPELYQTRHHFTICIVMISVLVVALVCSGSVRIGTDRFHMIAGYTISITQFLLFYWVLRIVSSHPIRMLLLAKVFSSNLVMERV